MSLPVSIALLLIAIHIATGYQAYNYNSNYNKKTNYPGQQPVARARGQWRYTPYWAGQEAVGRKQQLYNYNQYGNNRYNADTPQNQQPYYVPYYYTTPRYWVDSYDYSPPLGTPKIPTQVIEKTTLLPLLHNVSIPGLKEGIILPEHQSLFEQIKEHNRQKLAKLAEFFGLNPAGSPAQPLVSPVVTPSPAPIVVPTPAPFVLPTLPTLAPLVLPTLPTLAPLVLPTFPPAAPVAAAPSDFVTVVESMQSGNTTVSSNTTMNPMGSASDKLTVTESPGMTAMSGCATGAVRGHPSDCTTFQYCLQGFWLDVKCSSSGNVPSVGVLRNACKC